MSHRAIDVNVLTLKVFPVLSVVILVGASPAMAYLDPVSGSMIAQLVLGGVAGFLVVIKLYWKALINKFSRLKGIRGKGSKGA